MDLLHESRSLVHTGKFWRQPETGFEWNGWTELYAILFDNYRTFLMFHIYIYIYTGKLNRLSGFDET